MPTKQPNQPVRFFKWLFSLGKQTCPNCGHKLDSSFAIDLDKLLYTCKKCGKEWI